MKKTKLTEEQILFALNQGNAGQPIADVCRQMGSKGRADAAIRLRAQAN